MLISEQRKLVFIHNHKTAGMATELWIREQCPDAVFRGHRHQLASEAIAELGETWGSYFSFGFVRNPWARLVSWWFMIQEHPDLYHHLPFWQYVRSFASFEDFIQHGTETIEDDNTTKSAARPQLEYLRGVTFIGKYENLHEDLQKIADATGLDKDHHFWKSNVSRIPKDYRDYYTSETRDLVAKRFTVDIDTFGYTF